MPAKSKTHGLPWFKDNSTIHGIADIVDIAGGRGKVQKAIWGVAILTALACLIVQLSGITISYLENETGSRDLAYHPTKLPTVMVCPTRLHLNDSVSEEANLYMKGFFNFLRHEILNPVDTGLIQGTAPNPRVDAMLATQYNGSVPAMLAALLKQPLLDRWETMPPTTGATVHESPINTIYGTCFLVWSDLNITDKLAEYANYGFVLPVRNELYGKEYQFRLFLGGKESVGVAPPLTEAILLYRARWYQIQVRVFERRQYAGRLGKRCNAGYTQSQYRYCGMKPVAESCAETDPKCQFYTPQPHGEMDPTDYRGTRFCNVKRDEREATCLFKLFADAADQREVMARCRRPCIEYAYDKTILVDTTDNDKVYVGVSLYSLAMSKVTVEYPLMTTVDYLAAVGGTAGLFFGASLLSCVQILVCLVGEAAMRKGPRIEDGEHSGKGNEGKNVCQRFWNPGGAQNSQKRMRQVTNRKQ